MLQLLGAELLDVGGELGIVLAERLELTAIMAVDLGLHRIRARKRGLLGHQRRHRSEREPSAVPQRLERGRSNPPLPNQLIEALEMPFLLRRHGMYTWGDTLFQALRHVEIVEFLLEAVGRRK